MVVRRQRGERRSPLQSGKIVRAPRSLVSFLAGFKSETVKRINEIRGTPGQPLWQRNYYERIIRNEDEFEKIREYIRTNPLRWAGDPENLE